MSEVKTEWFSVGLMVALCLCLSILSVQWAETERLKASENRLMQRVVDLEFQKYLINKKVGW